jgi:hypothetical protein
MEPWPLTKGCVMAWISVLEDGFEEMIATEELIQAERKVRKKKKKKKKKRRQEQKRKEKNAELRQSTACAEAMAVAAYRQAEHEFYYEEYEDYDEYECEYDDEQCAYYHQDCIEERNRDIRKQLYLRSQPAKALRHGRLEPHLRRLACRALCLEEGLRFRSLPPLRPQSPRIGFWRRRPRIFWALTEKARRRVCCTGFWIAS